MRINTISISNVKNALILRCIDFNDKNLKRIEIDDVVGVVVVVVQLLLSRKSMHLIRIEINDKKYALISTMKIKNALDLSMGGVGVGGGGGGGEEEMTNKSSLSLGRTSAGIGWFFWG